MAIDIRATVTCSLGTLISGSISDDYLQGSGLVKTRGSCEISGLITPAMGTVVTFSYTKGGVARSIPRKLRVLSSFADPFRRTTKVELGCKLTYLSDLQEPVKWDAFDDPENNEYDEDDQRIVTLPIHASSVMDKCLAELGITANTNPLTNKFSIAEFDFGGGYVQVLGDLLVSESYFGYLDSDEVLQVASLDQDGGTGPVYGSSDIVDLGPIGIGQLPGEAVTVSYSSLKLKDPDGDADNDALNWEYSRSESPVEVLISYDRTVGSTRTKLSKIYRSFELTQETTYYKQIGDKEVPYLRAIEESRLNASVAGALVQEYLQNGLSFVAGNVSSYTEEVYVYDAEGNQVFQERRRYDPAIVAVGAAGLPMVFSTTDYVTLPPSTNRYLTERTATTFEIVGEFTRTTTETYGLWNLTIAGQQSIAQARDSFQNSSEVETYINATLSGNLGLLDKVVDTRRTVLMSGQARPPAAERTNAAYAKDGDPNNGWRTESKAELELALGSATAQRRIEFSMPYAPDDIFSGPSGGPFTAAPSDAAAKANRYGRVQNRLLLGNRSGVNLQVAPERMPVAPFEPIYLQANGLTALYRVNGNQWAFDSSGIVCSTDALFWGAVGGTGTFWFPVAPGITTLPTTPAIVDGEMTATSVVLPYNETAIYDARIRLGNVVTKFDYALALLTEVEPLVVTLGITAARVKLLASEAGAVTVSGQAAALVRRYSMVSAAGSFALSGFGAGSVRDYAIGTNAGTFTATGQPAALVAERLPLIAEAGAFTLDGEDALFFKGANLSASTSTFAISGQDAYFTRNYLLAADTGQFDLAPESIQLNYVSPQFSLQSWTGNGSSQTITNGFEPGFVILQRTGTGGNRVGAVFDFVRGTTKYWSPNNLFLDTQITDNQSLTAFTSTGFTVGNASVVNQSSEPYVGFALKKGGSTATNNNGTIQSTVSASSDLYSIATYTGNGTAGATIGHGLGSLPDLVLIARLDTGFTIGIAGSHLIGDNYFIRMYYGDTSPAVSSTDRYRTAGTSTVTLGNDSSVNASGTSYAMYCFKSKTGVSKIATFTGPGNATTTIDTGFQPQFVLARHTNNTVNNSASHWHVYYRLAGGTGYATTFQLSSGTAPVTSTTFQLLSTGFSVDAGGVGNVSGGVTTALYLALA
jgi:hypothetical protein